MGDFAQLEVDWGAWEQDGQAWQCTGHAEVAGYESLLVITVMIPDPLVRSCRASCNWQGGDMPQDAAIQREALRLAIARAKRRWSDG